MFHTITIDDMPMNSDIVKVALKKYNDASRPNVRSWTLWSEIFKLKGGMTRYITKYLLLYLICL